MKKAGLMLVLLSILLLGGCAAKLPIGGTLSTEVPGTGNVLPEAQAPAELDRHQTATLYFRYLEEPYLAQEMRLITHSPSRPYELSLMTELISGPGSHSTELTALFPAGTQVISTVTQGRTLFVTLSREILDSYPDDADLSPADRLLRRRLCMQSIAATITENCDIDRVQILVEQAEGEKGSLRLRQSYFDPDAPADALADPLLRQEELLLSPVRTGSVVMNLWCSRDWQRLYQYVARKDPSTGAERVSYRDFVTAMENLPLLVSCQVEGGAVTQDGTQATLTLCGTTLSAGQESQHEGRVLRLCRENSLWRVTLSQLTGWLEE